MNEDKPEKMPPVPPFVRFVASAVPMVFDDSLSYYEALCALWKYVQDMTDVINNNATLEEEYIEKFNELKSFVDNYFDNLDVQEEINNKLDAMAEDGTLQELINNVLQPNVAWTFDTVADMQASENLVEGGFAQTLGFSAIGDGGGAMYKILDSGTPDNLNVFAIGDDLYAHNVNLGARKISLSELEQVTEGVFTLGEVEVTSPVELPRLNNRNIIIVDTVFRIKTSVLFPPYNPATYFILPSFVGCSFINETSDNSRVALSTTSVDTVGSKFTGCNFENVDCVYDTAYAQDFDFTNCYINSHTCFIEVTGTGTAQIRLISCSVEADSNKIVDAYSIQGVISGVYEGNATQDFYFFNSQRGIINIDNAWIESCKLLHLTGGTSAITNKSSIAVNNSYLNGYTDSTPQIYVDNPQYVEFSTSNTFFSAYNQNSRVCNCTPSQFFKFEGSFVYNQAESYVKEMGGENTYPYQLATVKDVKDLEDKRFYRKEQLLQANVGVDLTFGCGTYIMIIGRGAYGAINSINEYIVSCSKNQTYAYATKLSSTGSDSYLDATTLTPTKAAASDTTFTLNIISTLAYAAEIEMIKLY